MALAIAIAAWHTRSGGGSVALAIAIAAWHTRSGGGSVRTAELKHV